MNLKYRRMFSGEISAPIHSVVEGSIARCDADGSVEQAREIAHNCALTIGVLVETLASKGLLTAAEVGEIAGIVLDHRATEPTLEP